MYESLVSDGYEVFLTREPGGTKPGRKIRGILLQGSRGINSYTEFFLYLADRSQNISEIIRPKLQEGQIVISDRHFDSTIAYQMAGRGIPKKEIETIKNLEVFRDIEPDLTFLLDVDPAIVQKRVRYPDRIERESIDFHRCVRDAYLKLVKDNPLRITLIDAEDTIDNIHQKIKGKVLALIEEVNYE